MMGLLAPARDVGGVHLSTSVLVIIAIVVIAGGFLILGWRSPNRSPGAEDEARRERRD